jgi:hypothetical protein
MATEPTPAILAKMDFTMHVRTVAIDRVARTATYSGDMGIGAGAGTGLIVPARVVCAFAEDGTTTPVEVVLNPDTGDDAP